MSFIVEQERCIGVNLSYLEAKETLSTLQKHRNSRALHFHPKSLIVPLILKIHIRSDTAGSLFGRNTRF